VVTSNNSWVVYLMTLFGARTHCGNRALCTLLLNTFGPGPLGLSQCPFRLSCLLLHGFFAQCLDCASLSPRRDKWCA
jgi:hypothetical protein